MIVTDALVTRLYQRRRFGMKPGLEIEEALLAALGHPEAGGRFIHVAGTNGKGSVCAMLDAILRAAGYKVGLYTSPHLVRFNERFVINGQQIPDRELDPLIRRIEAAAEEVAATRGQEPTFFECSTAIAFDYFRGQGVDVAILETGMGGRLDATNTVRPVVSVITRIGLEHTAYLGDTVEAIAGEKAGIIKAGVPVVAGCMPEAALAVVRRVAAAAGASLLTAEEQASVRYCGGDWSGQIVDAATRDAVYGELQLALLGGHQVENLATVLTAVDVLRRPAGLAVEACAVRGGLAAVSWPGRCQVVRRRPPLIVDGAHNPDAGRALAGALSEVSSGTPLGLIVGMCQDKDVRGFLRHFEGHVSRLWAVPLRDERTLEPGVILAAARGRGMACEACRLHEALSRARAWAEAEDGAICVTGSFYLVGELLENQDRFLSGFRH